MRSQNTPPSPKLCRHPDGRAYVRLRGRFPYLGRFGTPEGSFGALYEDLVPPDTQLVNYDASRFGVITGKVLDRSGSPLAAVSVTALHHTEFGTAYTDADGHFALTFQGGSSIIVVFEKQG